MKFKMSTEYAIRTLLFMDSNHEQLTSAKDISENMDIPFKYLQKILRSLRDANLLKVVRGVKGGYQLNKELKDITLYDIYEIMEEPNGLKPSSTDTNTSLSLDKLYGTYEQLNIEFEKNLKKLTLEDFK